jgi:SAM-dependent methyltransferase
MISLPATCPSCDSTQLEALFEETWPIVALPDVRIGIALCSQCGFVFQNPAVPQDLAQIWYSRMNNYTNPSRQGLPPPRKALIVGEQIAFVSRHLPPNGSAWQVGSSDGYTLSRFQQTGWKVRAIEPSAAANKLAESLYGLETFTTDLESFVPPGNEQCDLLIMTHVLEHLYSPATALAHASRLIKEGGHLLIEVPSIMSPDEWCAGFFSFEHVSYFAPATLTRLLLQNGFDLLSPPEDAHDLHGNPAVRCLAAKRPRGSSPAAIPPNDFPRARAVCHRYWQREQEVWRNHNLRIQNAASGARRAVIWGGGIHTSQLFARCPALQSVPIDFIADNDPQKQGCHLRAIAVKPVAQIDLTDPDLLVIISTYAAEAEILKHLEQRADLRAQILPLYHSFDPALSGATAK